MRFVFLPILLFFSVLAAQLAAQTPSVFSGKLEDKSGEALAFVAILPNGDAMQGVLSDIEGRFTMQPKTAVKTLTFRSIGYETLTINIEEYIKKHPLSKDGDLGIITLQDANNALGEVTVFAGENPADVLMRKVVANRNRNNPEMLTTFQCETYNKVMLDILPNDSAFQKHTMRRDSSFMGKLFANKKNYQEGIEKEKRKFERNDSLSKMQHTMMMETVTERRFRAPNDNFERVLLNRVSGFENTGIVTMANLVQPFSFYGDYLPIMDKQYRNPVSIGSPALYFFDIKDTLYSGVDTVFILTFHPRKGRVFEALEGTIHVNSRHWAVQNVKTKPAFLSRLNWKIEQQYKFDTTANQWFPEELNFEASLPKYPTPYMGLKISGRSFITAVKINPKFQQRDFDLNNPLIIENDAYRKDDTLWQKYRDLAPLSTREARTYEWMDSIGEKKRFVLLGKMMNMMSSGKMPLGKGISLDLAQLIRSNNHENTRIGFGLTTAQAVPLIRPKRWESSIYAGYGIKDEAIKYGGSVLWRIAPSHQTNLQFSYQNDLREPGAPVELSRSGFVSRNLYARRFDGIEEYSLNLSSRVGKRLLLKMTGQTQYLQPKYNYTFIPRDPVTEVSNFRFTELVASAKYVFDEPQQTFFGVGVGGSNRFPIVEVAFAKGFDNVLRGHYSYEKAIFAMYQSRMIRRLGRLTWRVEAGKVWGNVPYSKLFALNQSSTGGLSVIALSNTFQTLSTDTIWMSDQFVNGYFRQEIGNVFYRKKWSSPFLLLSQNVALGDLKYPSVHQGLVFNTPVKPLLESGVILDNLLIINYLNAMNLGLGGGVFYRWGYGASTDWRRDLRFRLSFRVTL